MPLIRALAQRSIGPLKHISYQLSNRLQEKGETLSEAMSVVGPKLFSPLEISLIQVGEKTGKLGRVFVSLADWFGFIQRIRRQIISGLIYPAILYHVAVLVFGVVGVFYANYSTATVILYAAGVLGVPYALVILHCIFSRRHRQRAGFLKTLAGYAVLPLPIIGGVIHKLNSARFFRAFAISQQAGIGAPEAVSLSAETCTNVPLQRKFERIAEIMNRDGCAFSEAFKQCASSRDQQSLAFGLIETGDVAGRTDEMSERVAATYEEDTEESFKRIAKILPVLIYLGIAGAIGYFIIQFYLSLFGRLGL